MQSTRSRKRAPSEPLREFAAYAGEPRASNNLGSYRDAVAARESCWQAIRAGRNAAAVYRQAPGRAAVKVYALAREDSGHIATWELVHPRDGAAAKGNLTTAKQTNNGPIV